MSLTITLTFASEPGRYEVQILREIRKPLRTGSGDAHIQNGLTLLPVEFDLGDLVPGQYLIGIRRVPWDWTFDPIVIE